MEIHRFCFEPGVNPGWGPLRGSSGVTHTVISESCSLVKFRGWLITLIPYSTRLAPLGRFARRMALLATFMKDTMACQPLLLYHTCTNSGRWLRLAIINWNTHFQGLIKTTFTLFWVSMNLRNVCRSFRVCLACSPWEQKEHTWTLNHHRNTTQARWGD